MFPIRQTIYFGNKQILFTENNKKTKYSEVLFLTNTVCIKQVFPQSNSSVYALYNDGPPILDYMKGYGHTKGTVHYHHSFFLP